MGKEGSLRRVSDQDGPLWELVVQLPRSTREVFRRPVCPQEEGPMFTHWLYPPLAVSCSGGNDPLHAAGLYPLADPAGARRWQKALGQAPER